MESMGDAIKSLNLEEMNRRRQAYIRSLIQTEEEERGKIKYECELCQDAGYILHTGNDEKGFYYEVARDCICLEKRRVSKLMLSSKITEEFRKLNFNEFETKGRPAIVKDAYECSKAYAENFGNIKKLRQNSIALMGRPGSGKTHLLMAVANRLLSDGVEVIYFPWVEGFNEIKDDFDKLEQRVSKLKKAQVLYIDDLFKGRDEPTPFQKEQLFGIINYRYLENLPILISSEWSIGQMCGVDEGMGSRINEMCRDYKVTMTGGIELNYRLRE